MRVMMVTKFVPLPANTGGKRRSLAIVERYLARGDELVLVAHDDGSADLAELERRGVQVVTTRWRGGFSRSLRAILHAHSAILGRFYTPELHRKARAIARREPFDVLQIEYIHNCVYGDVAPALRVLDLHDVASDQARKIGALKRPPLRWLYQLEGVALAWRERNALTDYDVVTCVSQHDADQLGPQVLVAPNGWEAHPPLALPSGEHVLFVANFAFSTNVDAAQ
ncbi:MAG TPA: glycosyltransferase, partial [Polyangiales bacterium]